MRIIIATLIGVSIVFLLLLWHRYRPQQQQEECFIDVPKEIGAEYQQDVDDFINQYVSLATEVCAVQNTVIDGIAKTTLGTTAGPTQQDLSAAQTKAKQLAGVPIFNCLTFAGDQITLANNPLSITDLYTVFNNIPDDVGTRFYNSAKFSQSQLEALYNQIQGSLSAVTSTTAIPTTATEPFEGSCHTVCPEEMVKVILKQLPILKNSLAQAPPMTEYINQATDLNNKLQALSQQAQNGTLIGSVLQPSQ